MIALAADPLLPSRQPTALKVNKGNTTAIAFTIVAPENILQIRTLLPISLAPLFDLVRSVVIKVFLNTTRETPSKIKATTAAVQSADRSI
jgi:hypothetical protein